MQNISFLEPHHISGPISILGVPVDLGTDGSGTREAPDHLRQSGLPELLEASGAHVEDLGNISVPARGELYAGERNMKYAEGIISATNEAAAKVNQAVKAGHKVISLGGDHAGPLGTVAGAAHAFNEDMGVIWVDAHADLHTHETTISGNIHGMTAAALMGFGHPSLTDIFAKGPHVKKENFLFIGLKDLDQAEIDLIRRENLNIITMIDIVRDGLGPVFEAIDALKNRVPRVWVSQDIDGIDKNFAPATLMATPGGLTYREVTNIARYIGRTCPVIGAEIAELVPSRDEGEKTTKLALELIMTLLGGDYSWYTEYMNKYRA